MGMRWVILSFTHMYTYTTQPHVNTHTHTSKH